MLKIPSRKPNNTAPPEDAEVLEAMALSPVKKAEEILPAMSVENARQNSIALLLTNGYQRASTLKLSSEESNALTEEFPDYCFVRGAGGNQNAIYLEHMHLRNRFNEVLGMGQWAIVPMRHWAESTRSNKGEIGEIVFREVALLVRGCVVGTATGSMTYWKGNASQNYGDAFEGAKTAAFRLCAKEFGVGLQAYSKDWCEGWLKRYPGFERPVRQ